MKEIVWLGPRKKKLRMANLYIYIIPYKEIRKIISSSLPSSPPSLGFLLICNLRIPSVTLGIPMYAKWHRIWWRRPVAMETLHSFKASALLPPEQKKDSSRQLPNIRARAFRFARLRVNKGFFGWEDVRLEVVCVCVLRWCQSTLKLQVFDLGTFGYFWYLLSIDDCAISFGKLRKQTLVHFRHLGPAK